MKEIYERPDGSRGVKTVFDDSPECKSKTQQHFKKSADINNIMKRALKTGVIGNPATATQRQPTYGDFTSVPDYKTCLNAVIQMETDFNRLPAKIRSRFENNPEQLLMFLNDKNNLHEAIELGLVPKPEPVEPAPTPPVEPAPEN